MLATVSNDIAIPLNELSGDHVTRLKDRLSFANPAFVQALRAGKKGWGIDRQIQCFSEIDGYLRIPRGAHGLLKDIGPVKFIDSRLPVRASLGELPEVPLRDYQTHAADLFVRRTQGHIVIPCGGGKTRTALGIISRLRTRTLVLVHTLDLKRQWEGEIKKLLKLPLGRGIDVATIQSLGKKAPSDLFDYLDRFDLLILDEAHHVAASSFAAIVNNSRSKYRLGLTATPIREDGLTEYLRLFLGERVCEIRHEDLIERGVLVVPEVQLVETEFEFNYSGSADYARMIDALVRDDERNALIARTIHDAMQPEDLGLVLSNRISHLEAIQEHLQAHAFRSEILTGEVTKKKRAEVLARAAAREIDLLLATSLADEGLDLPILSKAFLTYPSRAQARTTQRLGRLMRPHPLKGKAVLYDFVDRVGILKSQFQQRRVLYRKILGVK